MKPYRIKELASKYVEYDMIQTYTELPAFPDPRLRLLHAVLNEHGALAPKSELYSLVVSLVQLGMDTHDLIDTEETRRSETEMRARQLKVLAGDYFSSRFYQLLSQAGQISMVSKISAAVCEVNRLKMDLYIKMQQSQLKAEEYLNKLTELKSEMFQLFTGMMEGAFVKLWPEMLQDVSRCETVLDEMDRFDSPSRFYQSWAYWHVMQEGTPEEQQCLSKQPEPSVIYDLRGKYELQSRLVSKLKAAADSLRHTAAKLESDQLKKVIQDLADSFLEKMAAHTRA
ncbi:heptaprenyl diphosphate synthase component 1 [Paenibacillus glycanilyticus]|uniref:heptaprenyl diphosphate synthase component 1 n=1 Tax=Paenibacillus glycanilyticus TaxID=126569 RepID=UPI00203BA3A4|nr:heptaprenyl diphosphate synthase component 1 [Paenibacillus glycanilyticus]MCM3627452.1 heptaprenyl diphosphate synthase component 1 [Paenibacillus glycanilyticus]